MASQETTARAQSVHNNDTNELKRLTINHEVFKASLGDLILAPIDLSSSSTHRILDSACSDGTWLKDIQATFPSHQYTGTDIDATILPANHKGITYQPQDINIPWPASFKSHFTLVHQRLVLAGAPGPLLHAAIKALFELIEPGGWIQLEEMAATEQVAIPGISGELGRLIKGVFEKIGSQWDFADRMEEILKEEGLVDVEVEDVVVGFGKKSVRGEEGLEERGVEAWMMGCGGLDDGVWWIVLGSKEFSTEELAALPDNTKKELEEVGAEFIMRVVWGRKPL